MAKIFKCKGITGCSDKLTASVVAIKIAGELLQMT